MTRKAKQWDGLCPAKKHGLDHANQRCDLCPINLLDLSIGELETAILNLKTLWDGRRITLCSCGRGELYTDRTTLALSGWHWRMIRHVPIDFSGVAGAACWLCPDCSKED
jgi:hypothetical protein